MGQLNYRVVVKALIPVQLAASTLSLHFQSLISLLRLNSSACRKSGLELFKPQSGLALSLVLVFLFCFFKGHTSCV